MALLGLLAGLAAAGFSAAGFALGAALGSPGLVNVVGLGGLSLAARLVGAGVLFAVVVLLEVVFEVLFELLDELELAAGVPVGLCGA